jgi:hypothetical protein
VKVLPSTELRDFIMPACSKISASACFLTMCTLRSPLRLKTRAQVAMGQGKCPMRDCCCNMGEIGNDCAKIISSGDPSEIFPRQTREAQTRNCQPQKQWSTLISLHSNYNCNFHCDNITGSLPRVGRQKRTLVRQRQSSRGSFFIHSPPLPSFVTAVHPCTSL